MINCKSLQFSNKQNKLIDSNKKNSLLILLQNIIY